MIVGWFWAFFMENDNIRERTTRGRLWAKFYFDMLWFRFMLIDQSVLNGLSYILHERISAEFSVNVTTDLSVWHIYDLVSGMIFER